MATEPFFAGAYTFFENQLQIFLNERLQNVTHAVVGPLTSAIVIYIVIYAIAIMRGVVSEPLTDFIWRMGKVCVIFVAATTVAYQDWIVDPIFHAAPAALTQAIAGQGYDNTGTNFDKLYAFADGTLTTLRDHPGNYNPVTALTVGFQLTLVAVILEVVAIAVCVIGFALTVFALLGLSITIALGPIFIALSLFEWGKGMFQGWLRQAFNYVVQLAVITAMSSLMIALAAKAIPQPPVDQNIANQAYRVIVFYLFGGFFFFQASGIASGITGGVGSSGGELLASGVAAATLAARRVSKMMPKRTPRKPGSGGEISA